MFGSVAVFDPCPFGLLTMIVSLEAIFLSTFVKVSQNRQVTSRRSSSRARARWNRGQGFRRWPRTRCERGPATAGARQARRVRPAGCPPTGGGSVAGTKLRVRMASRRPPVPATGWDVAVAAGQDDRRQAGWSPLSVAVGYRHGAPGGYGNDIQLDRRPSSSATRPA
ncbi:DUF1003 domain-containing protein [Streptomyces sp. NPDC002763]|uniref:DUF1003 domain-containing protein n=1 Tax=Streptomyces sp. NPDC002763 TaxID=3154427 RepID=UPI00331ADD80